MKRVMSLTVTAALLCGCATPYTPQMRLADSNQCQAMGSGPGAATYAACMDTRKWARDEEQKAKSKQVAAALLVGALVVGGVAVAANNPGYFGGGSTPRYRGNCQYSWQYDAAGRRCGNRAASVRPGGY